MQIRNLESLAVTLRAMNKFDRLLFLVVARYLCLLLCIPAATQVQAQTCAFNLRVQFADGPIACLDLIRNEAKHGSRFELPTA